MGEIADMMLEGLLCEGCGELIGDGSGTPPGYPVRCAGCQLTRPDPRERPPQPLQPVAPLSNREKKRRDWREARRRRQRKLAREAGR